jgi:hypothetical protein
LRSFGPCGRLRMTAKTKRRLGMMTKKQKAPRDDNAVGATRQSVPVFTSEILRFAQDDMRSFCGRVRVLRTTSMN